MASHIGVLRPLVALALSMVVFQPKWKAYLEGGPRSIIFAAALVIGLFALSMVSGR